MRNNRAREDRDRRPEPRPFPAYKSPDPEPGRPKLRLITCPNTWCNQSFYHEYVNDVQHAEGYCEACGFEYSGSAAAPRCPGAAEDVDLDDVA